MDKPLRDQADAYFLEAFWNLTTCRAFGMTEGPIPWTAVVQYADREGLDNVASDAFVRVMQVLDSAYLEWREKHRSK